MSEQKNIQTIAPFLADDFVDLDDPIFDTDKYSEFLSQNSDRLGTFKKYLTCKLHDSWVIDINHDFNRLTISLNDFSTYVFADTLIEKFQLPIDSDNISFPLTIELEGNLKIEYDSVDDGGFLHRIEPIDLDEYLYEQVTAIDNERIEIVFHFWKSNLKDDKPGDNVIMIVSAKKLALTEKQDQAWKDIFGHEYDNLFKYFRNQFESDRYVSDHNECEKIIDEYEKNRIADQRKPTA